MPYEQGLSDWRVYSAEESVGEREPITHTEAVSFIDAVTASVWWKEAFPHCAPIEVTVGGDEPSDATGLGFIRSFAYPVGEFAPERWVISMHPSMLDTRVLIHELAHCASPSIHGDIDRIREGYVASGRYASHGSMFAATCALIGENLLPVDHREHQDAYRHFEVPVASRTELAEALAIEPDIYAALVQRREVDDRETAEFEAAFAEKHGKPMNRGHIPQWSWGDWLWMRRSSNGHSRKTSQREIAEAISPVIPTRPAHISQIEHSKERPTDPKQLTRAMCAAIYLGVDPIWTRYVKGLTRWDCGDISIDQARVINPAWADLVEHLNHLLVQRPRRWQVDGARM